MSSPEPTAATLSVDDIAAMSDAELAQFMEKHRCPDGDYDLPIDGWDKLSKDERRLRDISPDGNNISSRAGPQVTERSRSPTVSVDEEAERSDHETEAYHELANDGGRPLYPIDLLEQVLRPREIQEFVRTTAPSMQHATQREQTEKAAKRGNRRREGSTH